MKALVYSTTARVLNAIHGVDPAIFDIFLPSYTSTEMGFWQGPSFSKHDSGFAFYVKAAFSAETRSL